MLAVQLTEHHGRAVVCSRPSGQPVTDPADPRRFLDPAVLARIGRLDLRAKQAVEGFITGQHTSHFFGHSVEFAQHREYVRGDDLRHLDWKVWSKTDRFYIKQYESETNLRVTFVVDVSESMRYGKAPWTKYDSASTIAACLAYLALRQHDAAGLVSFDSAVRQVVPARSSMTHVDSLVSALNVSKPKEKTDLEQICRRVAEVVPSRGMVVLISDLLCDRGPLFRGLEMLRHRRHDILVFHVLDDDELDFPFAGTTRFEGMEEMPELLCDPRALRDGYLAELEEYLTELRRGCSKRGIDYTLIRTQACLEAALSRYLNFRNAVQKNGGRAPAGT
ncbi:MAG: DUF58 domain-containing protein [Gemmataceae bacterium]|nr:DUF58 domain-containing protein [Gemmataceae bacterium]